MDEEQNPQVADTTPVDERKGFNITSLVLGIISVVCFYSWYVSLPCGIIAIIFGIAGRDRGGRGMGIAGLILGIIGVVLCLLLFFSALAIVSSVSSLF